MEYTTEGDVRGCCDHKHQSIKAAAACLKRDQEGCARQGGYSDRRIVRLTIDERGVWRTEPLTESEQDEYYAIA
jgi:hypothetical protein